VRNLKASLLIAFDPVFLWPCKIWASQSSPIPISALGITPCYAVLMAVLKDPEDGTTMTLIFANQTEEDILLKAELDALASRHADRFKVGTDSIRAPYPPTERACIKLTDGPLAFIPGFRCTMSCPSHQNHGRVVAAISQKLSCGRSCFLQIPRHSVLCADRRGYWIMFVSRAYKRWATALRTWLSFESTLLHQLLDVHTFGQVIMVVYHCHA